VPKPLALTVDDTSAALDLGLTTVYELISQGKLKTVAIGRRLLVLYSSIEGLLQPPAA
jgi:excisionase family DNA binding protein